MDTLKQLATRTRVEGLVIMLAAGGYLWEAGNVPEFYQLPDAPGPTSFPYLLGIVFALAGLWQLVSPVELWSLRKGAEPGASEATASAGPAPAAWLRQLAGNWHFYVLWLVVLAYLWFMPDLGFPVSTFLLVAIFTYLLGETRWGVCLGLSLVATAVIYVSFKYGLNVRLPLGVLEIWFK